MAEEKKEAKTSEKRDYTIPIIFVIIVLAFAGTFVALKMLRTNEYEVGGLRVLAKQDPVGEGKRILSPQKILLQENLFEGNSTKNSAVAVQAAEITRVLRALGKNISAYGVVGGVPLNGTCNAENNYCTGARVVVTLKDVAQGACNCVKIGLNGDVIEVEGSEAFFVKDNYAIVKRVSGFIVGVVNG